MGPVTQSPGKCDSIYIGAVSRKILKLSRCFRLGIRKMLFKVEVDLFCFSSDRKLGKQA